MKKSSLVEFGIISDNISFIPVGKELVPPKFTAEPAAELFCEIARIHGSYNGHSKDYWKGKVHELHRQERQNNLFWQKILFGNPSAIQYQENRQTVIKTFRQTIFA